MTLTYHLQIVNLLAALLLLITLSTRVSAAE